AAGGVRRYRAVRELRRAADRDRPAVRRGGGDAGSGRELLPGAGGAGDLEGEVHDAAPGLSRHADSRGRHAPLDGEDLLQEHLRFRRQFRTVGRPTMPQFAFRATDRMGNVVEGTVAADSPLLAQARVRQMGYTPERVQVAAAPGVTPAVEPTAALPAHPGPVDLTQPITEMPSVVGAISVLSEGEGGEATQAEPLDPWQRGGPVPQPPAPTAVTQPMTPPPLPGAGAVAPLTPAASALPHVYAAPVSQGVA